MMVKFTDYIRQRLENNGYQFVKEFGEIDLFMRAPILTADTGMIWICHLTAEITPEQIRRMFDFQGHVLIVIDEKLIPDEIISRDQTPMWLRVIHGLYMGRIYVWNDRHLFGLHFDYSAGDISESGIIQPDELLLVETGTWLRGWTDVYKLARFYDRAWWTETGNNYAYGTYEHARQQSNARNEYEQARDHYQQAQREREQQYRQRDYSAPPKQSSSKPDFMREFARAGSPSAVKALYRELAKRYHPDLNPGVDTTVEMQAVNAAYEYYR